MSATTPDSSSLRPDFTRQELGVIHQLLEPDHLLALTFDLAYLLPSGALIAFGVIYSAKGAFVIAFGLVVCFKIWEWTHQLRARPVYTSIIQKYEESLDHFEDALSARRT